MKTILGLLFFLALPFILLAAIPVVLAMVALWPLILAIALFAGGVALKRC